MITPYPSPLLLCGCWPSASRGSKIPWLLIPTPDPSIHPDFFSSLLPMPFVCCSNPPIPPPIMSKPSPTLSLFSTSISLRSLASLSPLSAWQVMDIPWWSTSYNDSSEQPTWHRNPCWAFVFFSQWLALSCKLDTYSVIQDMHSSLWWLCVWFCCINYGSVPFRDATI